MIDPSSTRSIAYPLSWSESESRNPELWLNPYNGNTGTVIGKVTYNNGQDYPGVLIYGSLSGHNPDGLQKNPAWDYETSLTYNNSALKSDDILVENWGTTDVTPGHYHITTSAGGDLGWHDVVAGQVTYAGLFPVWLPYVRNKNGWNSTIVVRNNSDNYRAQVNITFFNGDGTVNYQRPSDYIDAHAAGTFGVPSGFDGSAMVVSSEDIAVVVREESGNELNEYNGIMASTNISASLGWERAGSIVYAPIIKKNLGNRSSKLFIANTGSAPTTAYIQFYNSDGSLSGSTMFQFLSVFGSVSVHSDNCTDAAGLCSAKVWSSNGQPLAAAILEQTDTTTQNRSTHNAFSAGATSNFVPLIKNNAGGQTTNLAVQNLGTVTTISVVCYPYPSGTSIQCGTPTSVQPNATVIFIMSAAGLPNGFLGSAVVSSSGQPIATLLYETGTPYKLVTNAPLMGTTTAYAPELYGNFWQNNQTWDSGISIQNTSSSANATITVSYYNQTGAFAGTWSNTIGPYRTWILNYALGNLPGNFRGSAVIQSTQAMAAVVNMAHTGTGDTKASYTVPNR